MTSTAEKENMRRSSYSPVEQSSPLMVDCEGRTGYPSLSPEEEKEIPSWANFRSKILSFTSGRCKSPTNRSPGSRSPTCRSPTGRCPMTRSSASRSPTARSPTASRSPARSPSSWSPICQSPVNRSPPIRSPTKHWPPAGPMALAKRGSFSRGSSRESKGSRESPPGGIVEVVDPTAVRRNSGSKVKRCLKKAFSLNLEGGEGEDNGDPGSPVGATGTVGGSGRKVKLKIQSSPVEQVLELTHLEDEESQAAAVRRPRKWSYHGTATPASPVEAPKRHSFSTGTGRAGIVVTNNDLASLLGQTHRLTPPGMPRPEDITPMPPPLPNPRARGRSQSIAVCWDAQQNPDNGGKAESDVPQAPITIRRTDCDHIAGTSLDCPEEEEETREESWDSSGSTIDASLLGSVIESFLKTTKEDEANGGVTSSLKGLQVK